MYAGLETVFTIELCYIDGVCHTKRHLAVIFESSDGSGSASGSMCKARVWISR